MESCLLVTKGVDRRGREVAVCGLTLCGTEVAGNKLCVGVEKVVYETKKIKY